MHIKKLRYIQGDVYSFISILFIWIAAIASLYSDTANKIGLYVALPIAFFFSTLKNRGFHFSVYEKILYALYAWDCFSYLWADNKEFAAGEIHMLLGAFLLTYVISILAREKKNIPYLYFAFILLYLSAWNYARQNILVFMVGDNDRLNDDKLNANTLAYYTFYISFLTFMLSEIVKSKRLKNIWTWAFWLMLPVSFATALLTASRQVLLVQIPLYALLIYIRYLKGVSVKRQIAFAVAGLICLIILAGPIINTLSNSFLGARAESNVNDDPRMALAINALQVGIANLPLGIGASNFQTISVTLQIAHNSYLEAFADMGIPGLALYTALMLVFTLRQWKRYRESHNKMYFAFFTFGLIYIFDGVFFVFYNAIWLISFFMLVAAHSETYFKDKSSTTEVYKGSAINKNLK